MTWGTGQAHSWGSVIQFLITVIGDCLCYTPKRRPLLSFSLDIKLPLHPMCPIKPVLHHYQGFSYLIKWHLLVQRGCISGVKRCTMRSRHSWDLKVGIPEPLEEDRTATSAPGDRPWRDERMEGGDGVESHEHKPHKETTQSRFRLRKGRLARHLQSNISGRFRLHWTFLTKLEPNQREAVIWDYPPSLPAVCMSKTKSESTN